VVEPSTLDCRNMGDVAMLQVAVGRLRGLWPSARIEVLTDAPLALAAHCPGTVPLSHSGRREWCSDRALLGEWHRRAPAPVGAALSAAARKLRRDWPAGLEGLLRAKARLRRRDDGARRGFLRSMEQADLYVVSGAMTLTDKAASHAAVVLDTMAIALSGGVPAAMMSQGIGPIRDPKLLAKARSILPRAGLVAVREAVFGPARLEALGVERDRVVVTGDDAVALALQVVPEKRAAAIGVNLRLGRSSDAAPEIVPVVRAAVRNAAARRGASLLPIPIAFHAASDDPAVLQELLSNTRETSGGGRELETTGSLLEQTSRCRLVVTGAYHAAVFALGQGIPVVALASNEDYFEKFRGLADSFGRGCRIVSLRETTLERDLAAAVDEAWDSADAVREPLREAARRLSESGAAAYARLPELVGAGGVAAGSRGAA
jgi:polysaccharide pyruvyl transferase WcaK-like protein